MSSRKHVHTFQINGHPLLFKIECSVGGASWNTLMHGF